MSELTAMLAVTTGNAGTGNAQAAVVTPATNQGQQQRNHDKRQQGQVPGCGSQAPNLYQCFEGREPFLKGHIYNLPSQQKPNQYIKTTKELVSYVGREYKEYTGSFLQAVKDLTLTMPKEPKWPVPTNAIAVQIWKFELQEYCDKTNACKNFLAGHYNVALGQCMEALEDKVKSHKDFEAANRNGLRLLTIIKAITYTFKEQRKLANALTDLKETFYSMGQGRNQLLQQYHELFTNHIEVMESVGCSVADKSLV